MSEGSFRDRLSALSRRELAGLAAVVLVTLAGVGLWYARSLPRAVEVQSVSEAGPGPEAQERATPSPAPVLVHVAGWVRRPGVYELAEGDRVVDALGAAGGPRKGAYLDVLNLAARLADGQQVLVPKAIPGPAGPGTPVLSGPGGQVPGAPAVLNLNVATASDLETLPGIGEVIAQRIVDHRTEHGPFASVDDLLDVSGIGEITLEELRDLVTV
jgi:competence protein ComEA